MKEENHIVELSAEDWKFIRELAEEQAKDETIGKGYRKELTALAAKIKAHEININ